MDTSKSNFLTCLSESCCSQLSQLTRSSLQQCYASVKHNIHGSCDVDVTVMKPPLGSVSLMLALDDFWMMANGFFSGMLKMHCHHMAHAKENRRTTELTSTSRFPHVLTVLCAHLPTPERPLTEDSMPSTPRRGLIPKESKRVLKSLGHLLNTPPRCFRESQATGFQILCDSFRCFCGAQGYLGLETFARPGEKFVNGGQCPMSGTVQISVHGHPTCHWNTCHWKLTLPGLSLHNTRCQDLRMTTPCSSVATASPLRPSPTDLSGPNAPAILLRYALSH